MGGFGGVGVGAGAAVVSHVELLYQVHQRALFSPLGFPVGQGEGDGALLRVLVQSDGQAEGVSQVGVQGFAGGSGAASASGAAFCVTVRLFQHEGAVGGCGACFVRHRHLRHEAQYSGGGGGGSGSGLLGDAARNDGLPHALARRHSCCRHPAERYEEGLLLAVQGDFHPQCAQRAFRQHFSASENLTANLYVRFR